MTRVAIVLPYFGLGGAEMMVSLLASRLDKDKIDAEVICIYGNAQGNSLEKRVTDAGIPIKYLGKGKGFSFKAVRDLSKELDRFSPDVVHTHLMGCVYSSFWVRKHRAVMLHTLHNLPQYEARKKPRRMLMSYLYKKKKAVPVAISDTLKRQTAQFYSLPEDSVERVYNPVETERFEKALRDNQKNDGFTFIAVGRMEPQKNYPLMFDAFDAFLSQGAKAQLRILGGGPFEEEIRACAGTKNCRDSIVFEGRVDNVADHLARANVFLMSSDYEGLPLSILEAMAAHLPIIATDVGGNSDIVADNGILVPPRDKEALVSAMKKLYDDKSLTQQMSDASAQRVRQYDAGEIAREYETLYEKYASIKR